MEYNFREIEKRWQSQWVKDKTYHTTEDPAKEKFYVLNMFPYPSGAGLHVGHPLGYIASDIYARYKRLKGFNVLNPMGYDAYGLPAEQYAIQTGQHPEVTTVANIARYRQQLDNIGFSFDWDREIRTCDPKYYHWTQWAFEKMFGSFFCNSCQKAEPIEKLVEHFNEKGTEGLDVAESEHLEFTAEEWRAMSDVEKQKTLMNYRIAYLGETMVNWCAGLGTVLANDEVVNGVSERGGFPVVQKKMQQWCLRTSAYSQRLLDGLETVDWSDSIKETQKNWIGRSEGTEMQFKVAGQDFDFTIFTTRADTIFGVTFMVLAPESELVAQLTTAEHKAEVDEYLAYVKKRTELDRMANHNVTGVFSGSYAVNPFTGENIPIWISEYVLAGYGTGAIMAVPAHDSRDYAFAKHFNLPITPLIEGADVSEESFDAKEGIVCNSPAAGKETLDGFSLNGLSVKEAIAKTKQFVTEKGMGRVKVNYRLRDAIFSRQRYWGEPFPIYYKDGMPQMVPEDCLPLLLPEIETYKPTETGEPPLGRAKMWAWDVEKRQVVDKALVDNKTVFPLELNTMPGFAGSSAYYLRYMDPHNDTCLVGKDADNYWQNVDLYVGGCEHATGHLIYSRFWNKFLFDLGVSCKEEPFQKLVNQGLILGEDGQKMSKSRGNVVNPDDIVREYGADSLRLYEMFMGPLKDVKPWATKGVEGISRFLARVWRVAFRENQEGEWEINSKLVENAPEAGVLAVRKELHKTIKKVTEDINGMSFNTAIAKMMECTNAMTSADVVDVQDYDAFLTLLNPFAPHLTEEIHSRLQTAFPALAQTQLCQKSWPEWEEALLEENTVPMVIQMNGKLRDKLEVPKDISREELEKLALASAKVKTFLDGVTVRKVIVVPGRLVNIVAN